jgi:hypothetical protein
MARKYEVNVTFDLETRIEAEFGYDTFEVDHDSIKESDESNYFSDQEITVDGGNMTFVIEVDSPDEAEAIVSEKFVDGNEVEDQNGFTWVFANVQIEIEAKEVEIGSLSEAREVITEFMSGWDGDDEHPAFRVAVDYVLDTASAQTLRVQSLEKQLSELHALVADLQTQVDALSAKVAQNEQVETPFGPSEEPTIA